MPFKPGNNPPDRAWWNGLLAAATRKLSVVSPLTLGGTDDARTMGYSPPMQLDALITGRSGSAYSWIEAYHLAGRWYALPGGREGVNNAYELNGLSTIPTGASIYLRYTSADDYRFEWVRGGGATGGFPPPPSPTDRALCVIFTTTCCFVPAAATATYSYNGDVIGVGSGVDYARGCWATIALPADIPTGARIDVLVEASPFPSQTLIITVTNLLLTSYTFAGWDLYDMIPDNTLIFTDPAGNEISLTRNASLRLWTGSRAYTYLGRPISIQYQFGNLRLAYNPTGYLWTGPLIIYGGGGPCGLLMIWGNNAFFDSGFPDTDLGAYLGDPTSPTNPYVTASRICTPPMYSWVNLQAGPDPAQIRIGDISRLFGNLPHTYTVTA